MLGRLGFAGRLMAIVLFALIAMWAAGLAWLFISETHDDLVARLFPLPEQVTGIVELMEKVDPPERPMVLKAVNNDTLQVTIIHDRPLVAPGVRRMPLVESFLSIYLRALQPRDVIALGSRNLLPHWQQWRNDRRSIRFAVSLRDGDYVMFEAFGPMARRLFGWPPGFGIGILGALIGIAAVIAIVREARPLRALGRSLEQFTGDVPAPQVRPAGAPEIRKLITSVNDMQARIFELVRGRTLLLGAVSHDLKTYITRLRLRVERLTEEEQRDKAASDLDEMTRLLDDALAVARGGFATAQRQPVDLQALLAGLVEDRMQSGSAIRAELGDAPLVIKGEPVAARRLFVNLIENALRFAPHCVVRLLRDQGAVVAIDDDGPGIPPEARDLVFQPFFRLESSRSRTTGGSGLGLAIVKQIADALGARVALATSPEGGLRVTVMFADDA